MITLILTNLHKGSKRKYELEKLYDFDKLAADFGPVINSIVGNTEDLRIAADKVAEYLSNHHLHVEVLDPEDNEEIYDPNVETSEPSGKAPEKAVDLKDLLESYNEAENLDIADHHVLNAAAHHWEDDES